MNTDRGIGTRIAMFPSWHFDFVLGGHRTNPARAEWQEFRRRYFFDPAVTHFGGSLEGKKVLDLGCNAGFFSLQAIEAGCDFVLGVDGRQTHIDQAGLVFEAKKVDRDRYHFACANILDFDYASLGPFDLILCVGVLYHINKPISLLEALTPVSTDTMVIETTLSTASGAFLELRRESLDVSVNAVDYELVMLPTAEAVIFMTELFGNTTRVLALPEIDDDFVNREPLMSHYRNGLVQAFVCAKEWDLSSGSGFQFRSLKSLRQDQVSHVKAVRARRKKSRSKE